MGSFISIPVKYVITGTLADRPEFGQFEGQIYYATDEDSSYTWDGSIWQDSSVDLNNVNKLIGLNSLNILDLTAQASLDAGINANFERDIYSDADGYLDTINTSNTTAGFNEDKYINETLILNFNDNFEFTGSINRSYILKRTTTLNSKITNCNLNLKGDSAPGYGAKAKLLFQYEDLTSEYSSEIINDTGNYIEYTIENPNKLKKVINIKTYVSGTTDNCNYGVKNLIGYLLTPQDLIIETNPKIINSGFTKFMIVSNEEISGTGSVNYDITFDGSNYQENVESFKEYSITNTGTNLILKQNLLSGASSGFSATYNWGVLLW